MNVIKRFDGAEPALMMIDRRVRIAVAVAVAMMAAMASHPAADSALQRHDARDGQQEDEWPHRFTNIHIDFVISWQDGFKPDAALVAKALDLACNRYCPVDATLTYGAKISHRQVNSRPAAAG